jgi:hypothetical protein
MTDNTITENDDQKDELIPVETQPEEADTDPEGEEDADEDEDDERLATSEDDSDEEISTYNRRRRQRRRDMQRKARDEAERKIRILEQQNNEMLRRLAAVEGYAANTNAQTLEERIAKNQREIAQAEHFIAKATEAGNGDDVVAAMRIRDQAMSEAQQLAAARDRLAEARKQAATPRVDPNVVNYAKEWMSANPWYDPTGRDRDSAVTKSIDAELAREGYNPASRDYWEELTSRVAEAIGEGGSDAPAPAAKPKRRGPPTGATREHAPVSTKKEIYVTPERKQAMMEAGVWDDPVLRQRYLKAYQAYDNSAR